MVSKAAQELESSYHPTLWLILALGLELVLSGKAAQSVQFLKSFLQHAGLEHRNVVAQAKLIVDKLGEL